MSSRGAYGYGYGKGKEVGIKIGCAIGATIGLTVTVAITKGKDIMNFISQKLNRHDENDYKGWKIEDDNGKVKALKNGVKLFAFDDEDIIKIIDKYEKNIKKNK